MPEPRLRSRRQGRLRWPRRTARLRLTALYGGLFLLSGAALVAVTYGLFERVTAYKAPLLPHVPHAPGLQDLKLPTSLSQALPQLTKVSFLLTQDQRTLAKAAAPYSGTQIPTPPNKALSPYSQLLSRDQQKLTRDRHQLAQTVHQLAQDVHQIARAGSVEVAQRAADSHQLLVDSGIALIIVGVVALLAGWLIGGRVLRPIRTITRTARRISSASLHERLALAGPKDELKELGDTLDDLFGRLDAAFEAQRHFVANASHELRTPLTAERNLLQVALDDPHTSAEAWRSTARELLACNDEQNHLIEALFTLASSEGGLDDREPLDLSGIVETVLADRSDIGLGLHIESAVGPAPLDGDPRLIESLVANLLVNAIEHNLEGGHVDVSTFTRDGSAVLAVSNSGPVVSPDQIGRLFQPFQRLDPRRIHRSGHGLGLSIVRAIATAHGATVTAQARAGGGLSVEVTFAPPSHLQDGSFRTAPVFTLA